MKYLLSELLPNGKIISHNANLYYNNPLSRLLTQSDYDTLNSTISNSKTKIAIGSYIGNGASTRTIDIGFTPVFIIVAKYGYVFDDGSDIGGGITVTNIPAFNNAISITENGFIVVEESYKALNHNGTSYTYMGIQ